MELKLNVLLAKTDSLAGPFKNMITDFRQFFKNHQSAFLGEKKTYEAREDTVDDPGKRGNVKIQTTVNEKITWFADNSKPYIDALFSQEKTNASGTAVASLVVDGDDWGEYTSLELLRLKSLMENGDFYDMIQKIPVRSDAEEWTETENEMYARRAVWEQPMIKSTNKTTEKQDYILPDPNLKDGDMKGYQPVVAHRTTTIELGESTMQKFSGEISHRERAEMLQRRSILLTAIVEALKKCNEVVAVESNLTSDKIFGYLFMTRQAPEQE